MFYNEQDLAAMKVAEIRRNTGPAVMPQGIGASATNASAVKPAVAAKQSKAALTTEDIIGYAERLNGRFGSALTSLTLAIIIVLHFSHNPDWNNEE